jgi:membrane protein YdbS with pleckstrin-like domain
LPDKQPSRPSGRGGEGSGAGRVAALIYGGAALVAAVAFWVVTTFAGSYPAVARYAGAVWIFVLVMIVLMPIVIPRVRSRETARSIDEPGGQCPIQQREDA